MTQETPWGDHLDAPYGFRIIELTQGEVTIVSEEDYARLSPLKWSFNRTRGDYGHARHRPYVRGTGRAGKRTVTAMHRAVMETTSEIDHKNRNPLDNRRCNLRLTTRSANMHNTKQPGANRFKGVTKNGRGWLAQIGFEGKKYRSPNLTSEFEAALAYDELALKLYGPGASTNFGIADE